MGNKSTSVEVSHVDVYSSAQGRNLRPRSSEENYVPMPLTMKRALVEGRKFRHVKPSVEAVVESAWSREPLCGGPQLQKYLDNLPAAGFTKSKDGVSRFSRASDVSSSSLVEVPHGLNYTEPVVTVMSVSCVRDKSTTQTSSPISKVRSCCNPGDSTEETVNVKHSHKSPTLTNRRYSLIDMRTGLKKSKFTLELEEKLRQSKFNLGFDDDLHDWKEFSYSMGNPESGRRVVESLKRSPLGFAGLEGNVGKGLERVCLRDPLQYCAHNCQILGLCSVRSPNGVLPAHTENSYQALVVQDEISSKYNDVESLLKADVKHHKRDDCNCDRCMLAYLTEMGFPEEEPSNRRSPVSKNPKDSPKSCRKRVKERIRIVENENTRKSIEIIVSDRPTADHKVSHTLMGGESSQSNLSAATELDEDTTNRRIKRMFRKNNSAAIKERLYRTGNENQDDESTVNLASVEDVFTPGAGFNRSAEDVLQVQTTDGCFRRAAPLSGRQPNGDKRSSSSTLAASKSSSLSSVLSYRRVRQIFQSIIERSRARRRPRKNIHKFRELEELGLGVVKNNRWYPSDSKAFSIWHGMHQSVQGIQGEFKKYPRTYLKRLD